MTKININDIGKEIAKALKTYTAEVVEGMDQAKEEVAKETVRVLKKTSPRSNASGRHYADGWRAKKVGPAWVVHNATDYQLTHLLEKGHAKVNGGRVSGIPHIRPAEQRAILEYENKVEKVIKG